MAEGTETHGSQDGLATNDPEVSPSATPPPLPPRHLLDERPSTSLKVSKRPSRPQLQSQPTIALSLADVHTVSHQDRIPSTSTNHTLSRQTSTTWRPSQSRAASDTAETSSIHSYTPSESLLGDFQYHGRTSPAWKALSAQVETQSPADHTLAPEAHEFDIKFYHEFDPLEDLKPDGSNQELVLRDWKSKLKHFLIISSSGKPIWSRHGGGDDQLISSCVGVIQTLISFYQDANDQLMGFTAGDSRFVVVSKGHLHLLAITKLRESDAQLRNQLDSLYMQILSTLTLPSMERMFINRPSTDLRRPLQGTDSLLDALADGFMRGSPSTLLSALECLRLRNSHRRLINSSFLKVRSPSLLYGLIVASGRLVSVMRPKKHSLHPGDLDLILNMLFEAGGVRAGGGENWIPLCLPGFNKTGYLYMYVSFLDAGNSSSSTTTTTTTTTDKIADDDRPPTTNDTRGGATAQSSPAPDRENQVAMILISANKEAFFELRQMRNDLVTQLTSNGSLSTINIAIRRGRPLVHEIARQTHNDEPSLLRHFLYKSRGNVQFVMPSYAPHHNTLLARRRLLNLYHALHAAVHTKTAHLKVQYVVGRDAVGLVWETPLFELYAVAGPAATKQRLAAGANKVIEWVRREEERIFIIGGAVF